jgi:hypothetical protein
MYFKIKMVTLVHYFNDTSGSNSVVECLLPKQKVASSNLVSRSISLKTMVCFNC